MLAEGRMGYWSLFVFMGWQRSCTLKEAVGYKLLDPLAASVDPWLF